MKGKAALKELNADEDCAENKEAGIGRKFTESNLIFACVWKILNFAQYKLPRRTLFVENPMRYIFI